MGKSNRTSLIIVIGIVTTGLGSLLPLAHAEHRLIRCAKLLIAQSENHSIPSVSAEYTRAALSTLHRLRAIYFKDLDYTPGNHSVTATDRSWKKNKQRVARRVSAILDEEKGIQVDSSGEASRQILIASAFEGVENIQAELGKRAALVQQLQKEHSVEISRQAIASLIAYPLLSCAFVACVRLAIQHPNLLTAFLALLMRPFPEEGIRGFGLYSYGSRDEKRLSSALKRSQPHQWVYQSFDQKVPQAMVNSIFKRKRLHARDMNTFWFNAIYPTTTRGMTGQWLFYPSSNKSQISLKLSWVRSDEFLAYDPSIGQPVLIDILRITETLPPYPKRVPEKIEDGVGQLSLEPIAVTVPDRHSP